MNNKHYIIILLLTAGLLGACDTFRPSTTSPQPTTAPQPNTDYVSPTVRTQQRAMEPLPADSLPIEYSVKGIAAAPAGFESLMGQWVSTYDSEEMVHFLPGKYVSYYNGSKVVEEQMKYYRLCPSACTGEAEGTTPCFVLASDYQQSCFAILRQTSDQLILSMIGTEGEPLTYTRK